MKCLAEVGTIGTQSIFESGNNESCSTPVIISGRGHSLLVISVVLKFFYLDVYWLLDGWGLAGLATALPPLYSGWNIGTCILILWTNYLISVLTLCLVSDRPCLAVASYTDSNSSNDVDLIIPDFLKVISGSPFKNILSYDRKTTNKYKGNKSDFYMWNKYFITSFLWFSQQNSSDYHIFLKVDFLKLKKKKIIL